MKLAERFKKRIKDKQQINKDNVESKVNLPSKELLSATKRASIESPQSSDLSLIKIQRNRNLVRNTVDQSQSQKLDFFDKTIEPISLNFFKNLNEYEVIPGYYLIKNSGELDSLVLQNKLRYPKFNLPHYKELLNKGVEGDFSNLFTPTNINTWGLHEKLILALFAYRNIIYSELLSSNIIRRRFMHIIELNLLKPFYECIKTSIESSQAKDSQDSDYFPQKKRKYVYK